MARTTYIVVRVDYEADDRHEISQETDAMAGDIVIGRAAAHNGTVENGIHIVNITNCGISA